MEKIRDIRVEVREIFFVMAKDFYGGPACDHEIPQKHFEDTLRECLRSREYSRTLILEDETGVAGYFLLAITWSIEAGGMVIWLDELYFKPEYRGKGYGTQAERLAVKTAFDEIGMAAVNADTIRKNTRSQHVLEKVGFRFVGEDETFKYYRIER